jgi:acyl-CoA reductase-like NAD-dependent aldehyde dehydrogenase
MSDHDDQYIDGSWVPSSGRDHIAVLSASTEEVIGRVPAGTLDDVERAVEAAARAFPAWSSTPIEERAGALERIHAGVEARAKELAETIAAEMGAPIKMAQRIQVGLPMMVLGSYPQILRDFDFEEEIGNSLVVREPVGVVGAITPWNYPLHQVVAKVAPALAAGCTIVLKPSEVAPLSVFAFTEIVDAAGLPAGTFNLVSGTGPVVGEAIAAHPRVDMVSFTGSARAGRRVGEVASGSLKRVALELGGKSANVILDDADLTAAVTAGVKNCYLNSGQTCTALTRMLVPKDRMREAAEIAKGVAESFRPGDPLSADANLGPLASSEQRARVRGYIHTGIGEGATLVTGGADTPEGLDEGYYVRPTVFSDVENDMTIAREEIFGPVLSIIGYDDEEDAVRIANDTEYGLAGAVWSADADRAERVARRLRTGQVDVNGGAFNPLAPFGGFKHSGTGRELGRFGLEEFLEVKSLQR